MVGPEDRETFTQPLVAEVPASMGGHPARSHAGDRMLAGPYAVVAHLLADVDRGGVRKVGIRFSLSLGPRLAALWVLGGMQDAEDRLIIEPNFAVFGIELRRRGARTRERADADGHDGDFAAGDRRRGRSSGWPASRSASAASLTGVGVDRMETPEPVTVGCATVS